MLTEPAIWKHHLWNLETWEAETTRKANNIWFMRRVGPKNGRHCARVRGRCPACKHRMVKKKLPAKNQNQPRMDEKRFCKFAVGQTLNGRWNGPLFYFAMYNVWLGRALMSVNNGYLCLLFSESPNIICLNYYPAKSVQLTGHIGRLYTFSKKLLLCPNAAYYP